MKIVWIVQGDEAERLMLISGIVMLIILVGVWIWWRNR